MNFLYIIAQHGAVKNVFFFCYFMTLATIKPVQVFM